MRIGIHFSVTKHHGGVYQYALEILETLSKISGHEYTIFALNQDYPEKYLRDKGFRIISVQGKERPLYEKARALISLVIGSVTPRLSSFLYHHNLFWLISTPDRWAHLGMIKKIEDEKLDLMIYPTSSNLSFLSPTPAIVAVHDLAHRRYPEFPEVSAGGRWELREYSFQNQTKKALRILVDSVIGKEDVLEFYPKTDPKRIVVLPFLPPSYLNTKITSSQSEKIIKKYHLPKNYFFYPAKFWSHKHHLELVRALKICRDSGHKFSLVLTGTPTREFNMLPRVMKEIKKLGLTRYVHYLGHLEDQNEISAIYKRALALVMPTNFGPTNIPVLEAWAMGTPVIYSNVRGCREQLGEAGLLIDPSSPEDIAGAMIKMGSSHKLRRDLIKKGRARLKNWSRSDFRQKLEKTLTELPLK